MHNLPSIADNNRRWLAAIVFLALLIRLMAAYCQPNYVDEGYNYYLCKAGLRTVIGAMKTDVHTPVTQIAVYPLTLITDDIFFLRLPSVFCSTLTVFLTFFIFRYFAEENKALLLTLFIAVSYTLWNNDVLMRPYGPLTMFLALVWLGMLGIYKHGIPYCQEIGNNTRGCWIIFVIACLGAASYHLLGCLSLMVCACSILFMPHSKIAAKWHVLGCIAAGSLPSLMWFIWGPLQNKISSAPAPARETDIPACIANIPLYIFNFSSLQVFCDPDKHLWASLFQPYCSAARFYLGLLLICVLMWGAYRLFAADFWEGLFLAASAVVPLGILLWAAAKGMIDMFQVRYSHSFIIPLLIMLFYGMHKEAKTILLTTLLGISLTLCAAYPSHTQLWNQYWKSSIEFIEQRQQKGDIICVHLFYTVYSFCMAYNCDSISFNFENSGGTVLASSSDQRPAPGKLLTYPLAPNMCSGRLLNQFGRSRIFLVLCESEIENDAVLAWMLQYYNLFDGTEYRSLYNWADVRVYLLERKEN